MLLSASHPVTGVAASLISAVTLLFGAVGSVRRVQILLNTIWDVRPKPARNFLQGIQRFVIKRILSFTIVIGIGFLLLATLVVSAGLAALGSYLDGLKPVQRVLAPIDQFCDLLPVTLLFMMIFKVLPDGAYRLEDVVLGAAVTSLLFNFGKFLIGLYLGQSSVVNTFGAAGSLALLLIWIYYSAQILFLGAEFTQVYAKKYSRGLRPNSGMEVIPEHLVS